MRGGYTPPKWDEVPTLEQYARAHGVDMDYERLRVSRFVGQLKKTLLNEKVMCDPRAGKLAPALHEAWYTVDNLEETTDEIHRLVKAMLGDSSRLESSRKTEVVDGFGGKTAREHTVWTLKVRLQHHAYFSLASLVANRNFALFMLAISAAVFAAWLAYKQATL